MPKKSKNPSFSPPAEITPSAQKPEIQPVTLSDFYQKHYKILFNKLSIDEQETLKSNLAKPNRAIRGIEREFDDVSKFVRDVIAAAELDYDKIQTKKKADAERVKSVK